jgi:predicted dehydrogenase
MKNINKIVLIGCGNVAYSNKESNFSSHLSSIFKIKKFYLSAIIDNDLKKNVRLSKIFKNIYFSNNLIPTINNFKPDVITIATPTSTHYSITKKILNNSKFLPKLIFLEKPSCENLRELRELIFLSKKKKIPILVNHTRRFDKSYELIKKDLKKKIYGKIKYINVYYYKSLLHNGVHVIDTLNYLFDEDFMIFNSHKIDFNSNKDSGFDVILFGKKTKSRIFINSLNKISYQVFEFDFFFEKARLTLYDYGNKKVVKKIYENKSSFLPYYSLQNKGIEKYKFKNNYPFINAYNTIDNFLNTMDYSIINKYSIINSKNSMELIFNIFKKHEN